MEKVEALKKKEQWPLVKIVRIFDMPKSMHLTHTINTIFVKTSL